MRKGKRKESTEKEMPYHPPPLPSTLHRFKALTVTATLGCNHHPPSPPLTCIVTSPVPPNPLLPLHPVTLRLRLLLHPIVSALLPPRGSISSSEAAPCPKACLRCRDLEVYTTIHNLSPLSTTQSRTREFSSTTIRDPSRSRTPSTASGINRPKPRLSEPASPVPQPTPAWL